MIMLVVLLKQRLLGCVNAKRDLQTINQLCFKLLWFIPLPSLQCFQLAPPTASKPSAEKYRVAKLSERGPAPT